MNKIYQLYCFIVHRLSARNSYGHGIHSPYLYSFVQNVIYHQYNSFYAFRDIERERERLKKSMRRIKTKDYGTGNDRKAKVSHIAHKSLKPRKWAQLLFRVVNFSKANDVLELGTSLGITTAYLAAADSGIRCITLEGSPDTANVARKTFDTLHLKNIEIIEGNIDETLSQALLRFKQLDVVFFDANHREKPTLNYFGQCLQLAHNNTIFIFDDIYWSKEMGNAWKQIKKNGKITSTIDLFDLGIVFFNSNLPKKNYILKF